MEKKTTLKITEQQKRLLWDAIYGRRAARYSGSIQEGDKERIAEYDDLLKLLS